jgi:hypothetical protein
LNEQSLPKDACFRDSYQGRRRRKGSQAGKLRQIISETVGPREPVGSETAVRIRKASIDSSVVGPAERRRSRSSSKLVNCRGSDPTYSSFSSSLRNSTETGAASNRERTPRPFPSIGAGQRTGHNLRGPLKGFLRGYHRSSPGHASRLLGRQPEMRRRWVATASSDTASGS